MGGGGEESAATGDGRRGWEVVWSLGGPLFHRPQTHGPKAVLSLLLRDSASPGRSSTLQHVWGTHPVGWGWFWGRAEGRALSSCPRRRDCGEVCEFVAVSGKELSCPAWGACEVVSQSRTPGPFLWGQPGNGQATTEPGLSFQTFPGYPQTQPSGPAP